MRHHRNFLRHLLLPVFMCALAVPVMAQPTDHAPPSPPPPARNEDGQNRHMRDLLQGRHVEGHIAFLHAELRITPVQENLWAPVAAAMREDVQAMTEAEKNNAPNQSGPETAIQYLQNRADLAGLRAKGEARFLAAFQPLYNGLSPDQKRMADELLIPHEPD